MKLLIIGGAGRVGTILRPALEATYECYYYDRRAVPGVGDRSIVGDVSDNDSLTRTLNGMHGVIYLAMGVGASTDGRFTTNDVDESFNVNVRDFYRMTRIALELGVRRLIYASSLSVYSSRAKSAQPGMPGLDEAIPPDSWRPYGLSKRLGEQVCLAAAQAYPDAVVIALRLIRPLDDAEWASGNGSVATGRDTNVGCTGPGDLRRLFLAALACERRGAHIVQATGDVQDMRYPNRRVRELLSWSPRGE